MGLADFNAPGCRSTSSVEALTERLAFLNNIHPERNCALVIFPDIARDSSLRGLYDEEKGLQEAFFSLKQHCDTRFIELSLDIFHQPGFFFGILNDWNILW